jgi:hypothetical protein
VFSILVSFPDKKYSVEKRYTEFEDLHREVILNFVSDYAIE